MISQPGLRPGLVCFAPPLHQNSAALDEVLASADRRSYEAFKPIGDVIGSISMSNDRHLSVLSSLNPGQPRGVAPTTGAYRRGRPPCLPCPAQLISPQSPVLNSALSTQTQPSSSALRASAFQHSILSLSLKLSPQHSASSSVLSTQHSALSPQHSVLSTPSASQPSALSPQHQHSASALSTQSSALRLSGHQ